MKIKAFLDSNVFIAGLVSTTGASAEVLRLAEAKVFEIYISDLVVAECQRNFAKKLPEFLPYFYVAIEKLSPNVLKDIYRTDQRSSKLFPKTSDRIIFQTAKSAKINYLVTLNRKHFYLKTIKELAVFKIISPAEFLTELRKNLQLS